MRYLFSLRYLIIILASSIYLFGCTGGEKMSGMGTGNGDGVELLRFLKSKGYARSIFKLINRFKSSGFRIIQKIETQKPQFSV